jgi:hypothetical protein
VARPEVLDATLTAAEIALARAVIKSIESGADWTSTNSKLDKVRSLCSQLRRALVELEGSKLVANIDHARAYCRELRTVFLELNPSASIPFHCDERSCTLLRSPRTTCWLNHLEGMIAAHRVIEPANSLPNTQVPVPARTIHRSNLNVSAQKSSPKVVLARSQLLRQTIGCLALVLAYLIYHHIEIQLEMLKLPSIFAFPLQ